MPGIYVVLGDAKIAAFLRLAGAASWLLMAWPAFLGTVPGSSTAGSGSFPAQTHRQHLRTDLHVGLKTVPRNKREKHVQPNFL